MEYEPDTPPSLKNKLKQTLCLSCCYRTNRRESIRSQPSSSSSSSSTSEGDKKPSLIRSSSIWIKSKAHEFSAANIFGRSNKHHHRRHSTADFKYDPLSYALNFEDGYAADEELQLRNFSSRLPMSPPVETKSTGLASREISAFG